MRIMSADDEAVKGATGSPSPRCGLAISVGYVAAQQMPGSEVWVSAVLWGLALGLSASGLYSGAKKMREG